MKIGPVKWENHFLLNGMVKTRSHMVQMMVYIGKTDVKHCFVMKHHFREAKFMKIGPSESENHSLLKETVKTRSHIVKMMLYIGFYRKISGIFDLGIFIGFFFGDSLMMTGPIRIEKAIREAFL